MTFARELKLAVDKVDADVQKVFNRSVAQAFNETVLRTPVDTGQARRSWLLGNANDGRTGDKQLSFLEKDIEPFKGEVLLYANLPYIERLEDGYSQQSPYGMVKVTVARWQTIVEQNGG
jgi:hypothetical protein